MVLVWAYGLYGTFIIGYFHIKVRWRIYLIVKWSTVAYLIFITACWCFNPTFESDIVTVMALIAVIMVAGWGAKKLRGSFDLDINELLKN